MTAKDLIPFTKNDPRINRKGRPKSFDALRKLVQSVGNEVARDNRGEPIIIDGHVATVAEMIVRSWSKDAKHQRDFVEYGWGKVKDEVEQHNSGDVNLHVIYDTKPDA